MKKNHYASGIAVALSLLVVSLAGFHVASADSTDGNPVGNLENVSCSTVTGWTYDPDTTTTTVTPPPDTTTPPADNGGTTPPPDTTTPPDPGTPQDPGVCMSRYRWVNIQSGAVDNNAGCAAVGAVPAPNLSPDRGICASGEDRPLSGYDVSQINYSRGEWGGGNGGGGTIVMFQNNGWRCYQNGQKQDKDNTDVAVAYYCDFGDAYPATCPYDNVQMAPVTYPPFQGGGGNGDNVQMNFRGLLREIITAFAPLEVSASSGDSNSVLIYDGNKDAGGTLLATVPANQPRPDVNAVMGVSGDHGFMWTPTAALKDGQVHSIYVYGTNIQSPGQDTLLSNAPQSLQCAPNFTNSAPSKASLTCPPNGSFTNASLTVSFTSSDANNDGVRYLVDWDGNGSTDQIVPSGGAYAAQNTTQSASRTWSSAGQKTVIVTAEDSNGAVAPSSSCTFSLVDNVDNTDNTDNTDNGGVGTDNSGGGNGGGAQDAGFTVSGSKETAKLQFLGSLSGTSEPVTINTNPFGGFSEPVTLRLISVRSKASNSAPPADVAVTASFDGKPFTDNASTVQTYNGATGAYRGEQGLIGSVFRVTFSKSVNESYIATIQATSASNTAYFYLTLDPKTTAPSFNEI